MPIHLAAESHPAKGELDLLRDVVTVQNKWFRKVREAADRVRGLATETDWDEYRQLCARMQRL